MARPKRYLFDEVFSVGVEMPAPRPSVDVATMSSAVEEARREGYERGVRDGREEAATQASSQLAETTAQLVKRLKAVSQAAVAEQKNIQAEAASLGIAAARKLAPALIAREPTAEIEALLRDCLGELRDAPHLVVRVNDSMVDAIRELLTAVSRETGFAGRLVVIGEAGIAPGDGRIDWADGGIVRDSARIDRAIDAALARYLGTADPTPKDEDHG